MLVNNNYIFHPDYYIPHLTEVEQNMLWNSMSYSMKSVIYKLYELNNPNPVIRLIFPKIFGASNIINYRQHNILAKPLYIKDLLCLKNKIKDAYNIATLDNNLNPEYYKGMWDLLNALYEKEITTKENALKQQDIDNLATYENNIISLDLSNYLTIHNIGQYFYNPMFGLLKLAAIDNNKFIFICEDTSEFYAFNNKGVYESSNGCQICSIFPDEKLYLIHTKDPVLAWNIWKHTKVKYPNRAAIGEIYYFVNNNFVVEVTVDFMQNIDNQRYNAGNYFLTEDDAKNNIPKIKEAFEILMNNKIIER